jgi:hypothetical protein
VLAGVNPLRFSLDQGWVSFVGLRLGVPPARAGQPLLALSLTLFEVGRAF